MNDTNKVNNLQELCWSNVKRGNFIEAKTYAIEALQLSNKLNYNIGSYTAILALAHNYFIQADFVNASSFANKSLNVAQLIGYKKGISSSYSIIGSIYYRAGDLSKSLSYYTESLKLYEELNYTRGIIAGYSNLSNVWNKLEDYDKSIEYTKKAIIKQRIAMDSLGLVVLYHNLVDPYLKKNDIKNALKYENEALKICKLTNNTNGLAYSYFGISTIYSHQKKYDLALLMLDSTLVNAKKTGDYVLIATSYNAIAEIHFSQKKYNETLADLKEVTAILKNTDLPEVKIDYELLYKKLYDALDKPALAYSHYQSYITLKDKIKNSENIKEVTKKIILHEYEQNIKIQQAEQAQKDSDAALKAEKKNSIIVLLTATLFIILLITIILILFFARKNLKNAEQTLLLEQKVLRTQMNPHFIFNSLAMIHSYVIRNKTDIAGDYIVKFSKLLRNVLDNSRNDFVYISAEIKTLKNYLDVQKLIKENTFSYTINIDDDILQNEIYIPPMLAQPFIENALKHGFVDDKPNHAINIYFKMQHGILNFEITDNGIGYSESQKLNNENSEHHSLAINITKERLNNLSKNKKYVINICDIKDTYGKVIGTKVYFEIPYKISF